MSQTLTMLIHTGNTFNSKCIKKREMVNDLRLQLNCIIVLLPSSLVNR